MGKGIYQSTKKPPALQTDERPERACVVETRLSRSMRQQLGSQTLTSALKPLAVRERRVRHLTFKAAKLP